MSRLFGKATRHSTSVFFLYILLEFNGNQNIPIKQDWFTEIIAPVWVFSNPVSLHAQTDEGVFTEVNYTEHQNLITGCRVAGNHCLSIIHLVTLQLQRHREPNRVVGDTATLQSWHMPRDEWIQSRYRYVVYHVYGLPLATIAHDTKTVVYFTSAVSSRPPLRTRHDVVAVGSGCGQRIRKAEPAALGGGRVQKNTGATWYSGTIRLPCHAGPVSTQSRQTSVRRRDGGPASVAAAGAGRWRFANRCSRNGSLSRMRRVFCGTTRFATRESVTA